MGNGAQQLFNLEVTNVPNEQIIQNEISLGRWIVDAILLLLSLHESYDLRTKIPISEMGISYIPDIYLEKGCKALQLNGRTIIDLKNNLLLDTEIRQSEIYRHLIDERLVDRILIIYINSNGYNLTDSNILRRVTFIKADSFVKQIKEAINEEKGEVIKILNGRNTTTKRTWKDIRKDRLANAINDYNRFNSVLFLGAGVSASANIPTWQNLLKELLSNGNSITQNDFDNIYKAMDCSNLITARYIEKALRADKSIIVDHMRQILYSHNSIEVSELISAICNLVLVQKNIRSIISYNYDTLIEDALKNLGKSCFSVYKNNHNESNAFPVYHVHGIVFRKNESGQPEDIVLTEDDYHRVYSEVFDWSNVEQLHALTRCTCFFIGLSLNDPNLRRLLEIAQRDSGKSVRHYVFLERKSVYKELSKAEKDFQTREDMLADLGLSVIWYNGNDNHKELPELLAQFV